MNTGRYSLKQLLNSSEIDQIIIPELQRDYVWAKENVEGLLLSIFSNYKKKTVSELEIKNGNEEITQEVKSFLSNEYTRLRYNTQIGFIYAYHDVDYAGKFFLIDGQQRVTTLYLLLLALYKSEKKRDDFRKLYFKDNLLKLDYKVRETSHDFMVDFIGYMLDADENCDFDTSCKYYKELYSKDKTAKTLLNNYKTIVSFLGQNGVNNDHIDYVENFIEFNYFDTNLSEQGEQLYLYMNSRGESLSQQEIIKASLIKRSKNKLEAGEKWEKWQNFFWKNRGNNINADRGFEEFLKWATIIHICVSEEPQLKISHDIKQTAHQAKEDYVRLEQEESKRLKQEYWLKEYQKNNNSFDSEFLSGLFDALLKLEEYDLINAPFFSSNWLSNVKYTIDYVTICSALFYLNSNKKATKKHIESVCMYLKNICYYVDNTKNPDRTVIVALETLKKLNDLGCYDIVDIDNLEKVPAYFYSDSDRQIINLYKTPEREKWEKIFWSITNNNDICSFIAGDFTPLFNLCGDDTTDIFEMYFELFSTKIIKRKSSNNLRRELLEYGDISLSDGGGSWNLKSYMERWNLIEDDNDWRQILGDIDKVNIIKNYLDKSTPVLVADWRRFFIDENYSVLKYIEQNKFLWQDKEDDSSQNRIVLLAGHQAGESGAREIQIQLLHQCLDQSWVYKYDTCVIEFNILNSKVIIENRDNKNYYLDIQYQWNKAGGKWFLYVGHRSRKLCSDDSNAKYLIDNGGEFIDDKIKFTDPIYIEDNRKSMEINIDVVKIEIDKFLLKLMRHAEIIESIQ